MDCEDARRAENLAAHAVELKLRVEDRTAHAVREDASRAEDLAARVAVVASLPEPCTTTWKCSRTRGGSSVGAGGGWGEGG